jgi:Tol biopolymer transport system component
MTAQQRFERELPDLLADLYPVSAPDYRDDLVRQIAATRQRPAWTLPERWIPMSVLVLGRAVRPMPWRTIGALALLALTIVAIAIVAGSQRRLPPPFGPAANGRLVLAEGGDIFLVDSGTGAKTLAIGGPAQDSEPSFSRDGTRIAFLRETAGVRSLWLADDGGNTASELSTKGVEDFSQIEWAPDGKSILLSAVLDGRAAPAIVPTDGSVPHVLDIDLPAESPIWLPNGEILFRGFRSTGFGLFAIRPDGTGLRTVVAPTGVNEWDALSFGPSPDGSQVAYQWRPSANANQRIYVVPAAGGTPRAITSVESVGAFWSPDGTWIAVLGDDGVYVVRADGSTPERRVTPTASPGAASIRWAPDSSRLLVVASGQSDHLLFDPLGGPGDKAPWTSPNLPDWQRLAPTP